jgi:hypothetical protein
MPKLNTEQIIARLEGRIAELEACEEVAVKHIRALLTEAQQQALDDALAAQVELKKAKRARTDEEKTALGWKTIRQVRLDVLNAALAEARSGVIEDFERRRVAADVRQARIYFEALKTAQKAGKDLQAARTWANNELTRAGLRRLDEQNVRGMSARDKGVAEMEATLLAKFKTQMPAEEREQQEMLDELNGLGKKRKAGKRSAAGKAE